MRSPIIPHRLRAVLIAAAAAALVVLPGACGEADVVGPAPPLGHWRLTSIDGDPPANKQALAADGADASIDSIEIIFRRYGRLQDIRHLWRPQAFGPPLHFSDTMIVTYIIRRDSIFITRKRLAANETYADTGRTDGDVMDIAVRWNVGSPGANQVLFPVWQYTRIGETPP